MKKVWLTLSCLMALTILAVLPAQAQLASGVWPMFGHDIRHTGRSDYEGPGTPHLAWRYQLPAASDPGSGPIVGPDGTIYLGSAKNIYAINPDGSFGWQTYGCNVAACTPALAQDGTLYMPDYVQFYAITRNATKILFQLSTPFGYSSPCIAPDGTILVGHDQDGIGIDPISGTVAGSYRVGEDVHSSPAVGPDGTIYVRGITRFLCAVNPADGSEKWRIDLGSDGGAVNTGSPVVAKDGTIYTAGLTGLAWPDTMGLFAINPTDGSNKWPKPVADVANLSSTPCLGPDGTIYSKCIASNPMTATSPYQLTALSPSGSIKWTFDLPSNQPTVNPSPIVDADGTVYVTSNNYLYAINPDGTEKWRYDADFEIGQPVLGPKGTLYFTTSDGYLNAIVSSPIPPKHTGHISGAVDLLLNQ